VGKDRQGCTRIQRRISVTESPSERRSVHTELGLLRSRIGVRDEKASLGLRAMAGSSTFPGSAGLKNRAQHLGIRRSGRNPIYAHRCGANSLARLLVSASTAAQLAEYTEAPATGRLPLIELMLIIVPPSAPMSRTAAGVCKSTEATLTAKWCEKNLTRKIFVHRFAFLRSDTRAPHIDIAS
jgi:hypothetical protein